MVDIPADDWVTVAEAAKALGVSKRRALVLVRDGRIPGRMVGRQYLVRRADVAAFEPNGPGRPRKKPEPQEPKKKPKK